ncbi:MAG: DUF2508 family protein [Oscillospiraceae bacterium]
MKILSERKSNECDKEFRRQLFEDLDFVTERLAQIRESFDMTAEPELVDALIYEELAMKSRYDYLIRLAKERNIKCRMSISELPLRK